MEGWISVQIWAENDILIDNFGEMYVNVVNKTISWKQK